MACLQVAIWYFYCTFTMTHLYFQNLYMMLNLSIQNNEIKGFLPSTVYSHGPKLKMNDKKPSWFQFHFSGVLETFSMLRNEKKKLLTWTLEIIQFIRYSIQMDMTKRSIFFVEKCDISQLSNFAVMCYGRFPTRNGLK